MQEMASVIKENNVATAVIKKKIEDMGP